MPAPLLFVGDIHLGRSPHRLSTAGLDASRLDPAEAWRRVVRYALAHDVQAVVLAGDVVDQDKDRFEAWGHLHTGVRQLVKAGVHVLGAAGNHDSVALPRLADRIDAFTLLGRDGTWQREELDGVDLLGWSFPTRHYRGDPLLAPGLREAVEGRRSDALLLGVLHADLDAGDSPYAPVRSADLADQPVSGWFLGHIHQPHDFAGPRPLGYLGSLVGLDRNETGPRGPWLVTPTSASTLDTAQLALGPVHWSSLAVDLAGLLAGADAHDRIHAAMESRIVAAARDDVWLRDGDFAAVGCSVSFTGRTRARSEIREFITQRSPEELVFESDDVRWAVVHLHDATRPSRDLDALSEERSPLGQLARLLVDLDARGLDALPEEVRAALADFDPAPWSSDLERDPLPDRVDTARAAALHLLDQLLAQRPDPEVP